MPAKPADSYDSLADEVEAAKRGDSRACTALVAITKQQVFALIWRLLGNHRSEELVEDLMQETYARAFFKLGSFEIDGKAAFNTWLLTIAGRLTLNELRKFRPVTIRLESETLDVPSKDSADELARQRGLAEHVERAVNGLSDPLRAVLVLSKYHGLPHKEVARILNIRVGSVKSRLSRALRELEGDLAEYLR